MTKESWPPRGPTVTGKLVREGGNSLRLVGRRSTVLEERYSGHRARPAPGNTALKLADSVNLFETGSLAPGVTIKKMLNYKIIAVDAGMKYQGFFLQAEYYYRWLDSFQADGALPTAEINDHGFYVQASFYPLPKVLEVYGATSQIFGDK